MIGCSHSLVAHLVEETTWAELAVTLAYRSSQPYEVAVTISGQVEWKLSREFLRAGLEHPVGEGDVRLWPGRRTPTEQLFLQLSSPSGQALLELPLTAVEKFLTATEHVVPSGEESMAYSLDDELQALLDGDPS